MSSSKNFLTDEKVFIKYIPNFVNGITDKTHPLYGGLSTRSFIGISAPKPQELSEMFSKEEFEFLSSEMGETIHARSDFWKEFKKDDFGNYVGVFPIYLRKEGDLLHMTNIEDYIKYKILKSSPLIATSYEDAKARKEVRFLLLKESDLYKKDIDVISIKRKAYGLYTKYEDNEKVLRFLLRSLNYSIDPKSGIDFLQKQAFEEMERNYRGFTDILEDSRLLTKIKVNDFLQAGLIIRHNGLYFDQNNKALSIDGTINDLEGCSEYLESGLGSDFRLACEAKLNSTENKKLAETKKK